MKIEAEATKLHRMANIHDVLERWQRRQTLRGILQISHAQNHHVTVRGYISDPDENVKASWSNIYHDGAAAFKLSEKSPVPPAWSAKDLPAGRTKVLNVHRIKPLKGHPAETHEESSPECISDTENCLNWNGDLDNPHNCEDD